MRRRRAITASAACCGPRGVEWNLGVHLQAGETWRFESAVAHTVAWAALVEGQLHAPDAMHAGELLVFESGGGPIAFEAKADAVLVLGSAARHPYGLHMGSYSVHTSTQALRIGQQGIRHQAASLRRQGAAVIRRGRQQAAVTTPEAGRSIA